MAACLLTIFHKQIPLVDSALLSLLVRQSVRPPIGDGGMHARPGQARPRFISVHISLTSGCQGLLLHRYFTGSGYLLHQPSPQNRPKKKKTLWEAVTHANVRGVSPAPRHIWHPLRNV